MSEIDSLIKQGMAAFKAGRKEDAKNFFMQAVDLNQHSEQGWLWLSAVVDSDADRQICLANVLDINPNNERARKGLDLVNQKLGVAPSEPKPAPPPAKPSSPPARSSAPIGAEFASSSGDNFFDGFSNQPPANDNTSFEQPATGSFDWFTGGISEPAAPPPQQDFFGGSSAGINWGSASDSPPPAYGSGKDVAQPSPQEYDSWAQNLPLDKSNSDDGFSTSIAIDSSTPFGDTSYMVDDAGTKADRTPAANQNDPFGRSAFGVISSSWDNAAEESSATFSNEFEDDPFAHSESGAPGDSPFRDDLDDGGDLDFDFDAPEGGDVAHASPVFGSQKRTNAKTDEYFRLIPNEIEAKAGGGSSTRGLVMLGGVVVLLILNVISVVALVSAL